MLAHGRKTGMRVGFAKVMRALDPPSLSVRTSGEDRVEAPYVETGARMHMQARAHAPSTYGACEAESQQGPVVSKRAAPLRQAAARKSRRLSQSMRMILCVESAGKG